MLSFFFFLPLLTGYASLKNQLGSILYFREKLVKILCKFLLKGPVALGNQPSLGLFFERHLWSLMISLFIFKCILMLFCLLFLIVLIYGLSRLPALPPPPSPAPSPLFIVTGFLVLLSISERALLFY